MFKKFGSASAVVTSTTIENWNHFKTANQNTNIVAKLDEDAIYLHGTILASVDLQPGHEFFITPNTERFINDNGDCFPRDEVLKRYQTFKTNAKTYVEHNQGPEFAKGKCIDVVVRNMGDTCLVDVLFTIDAVHDKLINNVKKGIVTHLSMGCQTEFTKCSICGNIAHNEEEYCEHIKTSKKKVVKASDGKMRKVAELCYNNTWVDVSLVMNPAFGGAAIRQILSHDEMGRKVLANLLEKNMDVNSSSDYEKFLKAAAVNDVNIVRENTQQPGYIPYHPITNSTSDDDLSSQGFEPIPWNDPNDIKDDFDKDNPGNELEVEGPLNNLVDTNVWACSKCSNTFANVRKTASKDILFKCNKCGYIEEYSTSRFAYEHSSEIEKVSARKQVLEIVKDIIKNISGKIVPKKIVEDASEGYQFLQKEIVDELKSKGYKLASEETSLKIAEQLLDSYESADDVKKIADIYGKYGFNVELFIKAAANFNDVSSSEKYMLKAVESIDRQKLSRIDEDIVAKGLNLYIDKVYKKWKKSDISELIYDLFPMEASHILDKARLLQLR